MPIIRTRLIPLSKARTKGWGADSHKYLFRKPDGKGGWSYTYQAEKPAPHSQKEREARTPAEDAQHLAGIGIAAHEIHAHVMQAHELDSHAADRAVIEGYEAAERHAKQRGKQLDDPAMSSIYQRAQEGSASAAAARVAAKRAARAAEMKKAGQVYAGPKGGKWANPEHTVAYREGGDPRQPGQQLAKRPRRKRPKSVIHKLAAHLVFHAMKLVQHAMRGALDVARGAIEGASDALKTDPDGGQGGQFDQGLSPDKGDGSPQAAPAVPQLPPDVAKTLDSETLAAATEQLTEMHASAPVEHKPAIEMTYKALVQAHAEKQRAAKAAKLAAQHAAAGGDPFEAPGVGHPGAVHLPIKKTPPPAATGPVQSASDKATDAAKFKQAQQQRAQAAKPVATKKPDAGDRAITAASKLQQAKQARTKAQDAVDLKEGRRQPKSERVKTTPAGVPAGRKAPKLVMAKPAKKTTRNAAAKRPQAARVPKPKKATARSAAPVKRPPVAQKPASPRKPGKLGQAAKPRTQRVAVRKSLVLIKARKLHKRIKFRGLDLSIENEKGTLRRWYDPHVGREGFTKMKFDYGYVRNTLGTDGDHVDVYVGPNENADHVYIVTQLKAPDFLETDEQKAMLGFSSVADAQEAYLAHYSDPRFLGDIRTLPFEDFAGYVLNRDNHGELIRSNVRKMSLRKSGGYNMPHSANMDSQGVSAGERVAPQPVPDMRTWQQPKTAESKERERDANRRRRRAFARWSQGALSLYGEPPDRKVRYRHQYLTTFKDRKAMLATRTPQIVADPITDDSR